MDNDVSALEREYELEMMGIEPPEHEDDRLDELEKVSAYEGNDTDDGAEFESLRDEPDSEFEIGDDRSNYAERFYELAQREFESERELETAIGEILDDMEREYFFGGLLKKVKQAGKGLLKKGVQLAKMHPAFQAIKGITQLTRGNMKGMLGNLFKAALGAAAGAIPGAGAVLPALQALGIKLPVGGGPPSLGSLQQLVGVSREAYDQLALELTENADHPAEAARVAATAFQKALRQPRPSVTVTAGASRRRVIRVRRGDVLVIEVV